LAGFDMVRGEGKQREAEQTRSHGQERQGKVQVKMFPRRPAGDGGMEVRERELNRELGTKKRGGPEMRFISAVYPTQCTSSPVPVGAFPPIRKGFVLEGYWFFRS